MSTPNLATPTAPGISLGDLISTAAFEPEENMADETAPTVTTPPTATPTKGAKKPRKTPVKKTKVVAEDGENEEAVAGDAETETPTKAKKPHKTPVKKENVKPKEGEDANAEEPTTPKAAAPKKRGPAKKKSDATPVTPATPTGAENGDVGMTTPATNGATKSSGKKRGQAKAAVGETPTKKSKAAAGDTPAKRAGGTKFPECWAEFCAEDKLIVNMRREGKKWEEIEPAWTALTGSVPGKDSLRKRFAKLEAVAQDFNDDDLPKLVAAKKAIDADFIAIKDQMQVNQAAALKKMKDDQANALKKQEAEKWAKISKHIKTAGGSEYKAFLIEKKWKALEKSGEIDANGNLPGVADAEEEAVDEDMENLTVADESAATNGNGHVEDEVEADAMEE
ncbi:hypothetical protein BKA65DRAFT_562180 [Rhexocercosporidium sp. MPI-PUGE-AT-0058]|nr:hypothetical protein BKA65DRAFT_562180 [Rhexocercosporidium sp. MPI-PUGE-AT-0058]